MQFNEFMSLAIKEFYDLTTNYTPTYNLLKVCRMHKYYYFGYFVAKLLEKTEKCEFLDELAICAYYIGYYEEAYNLNKKILLTCDDKMKPRIEQNISFCKQKLLRR